ncbi:MAG: hypothetical protein JSS81_16515 [Acidobacteria bacterium]|nr:hypothetical protein [Acidobacteriota bacterium]
MNPRTKIKVIKKGAEKVTAAPAVTEKKTEPTNDSTKLASTVSDWISEFKDRRRQEAETAIERFNS